MDTTQDIEYEAAREAAVEDQIDRFLDQQADERQWAIDNAPEPPDEDDPERWAPRATSGSLTTTDPEALAEAPLYAWVRGRVKLVDGTEHRGRISFVPTPSQPRFVRIALPTECQLSASDRAQPARIFPIANVLELVPHEVIADTEPF